MHQTMITGGEIKKQIYLTNYNILIALDLWLSSLSNLANNFNKRICKIKCKYGYDKCKKCWTKYNDCECFPEYVSLKDDLIGYGRLCCNNNYQKRLMET